MTAQPLAPVIPSSRASAARRRARSAAARSLPLARAEAAPQHSRSGRSAVENFIGAIRAA